MTANGGVRGAAPRLLAVHTNEGPNPAGDEGRDRSAENLVGWMSKTPNSYNEVVDDDSVVVMVPDRLIANATRGANPVSWSLCFIGYAGWSRAEWLTHPNMLRLGAARLKAKADQWGIPYVHLLPSQVRTGRGLIGHWDWSIGAKDGTHTDPGAYFPWDVVLGLMQGTTTPTTGDDEMGYASWTQQDRNAFWADLDYRISNGNGGAKELHTAAGEAAGLAHLILDRVPGRFYVDDPTTQRPVEVAPGTPGAKIERAMGQMDGNYVVNLILDLAKGNTQAVIDSISSYAATEAARDTDDAARDAAVLAALGKLVSGQDPERIAAEVRAALGDQLATDVVHALGAALNAPAAQ